MAESLVSTVLNQLATITLQEVQLVRGLDAEIEKLTNNLQAIQAVLEDAEKRQVKEATVKLWVEKLKDVSYDIDDVLDEWNTAILKLEDSEDAEKVWSFRTLSSGFCFPKVCLRQGIALKIKELNVRLAAIANVKNIYKLKSGRGSQESRLLTTSVIDVSEVFEREQDADKIKTMLLSGNIEGATTLRIISIVGMGGLGKTTLARLVFKDTQVESHFDKRIWVCVSDPFDDKRIAIEILESLGGDTKLVGMDKILENIGALISGKKILLVLDDVWAEDPTRWEPLKGSLKLCSPESRILLTTRKEKVATVMGSGRTDMVSIGLLSEEGCWKLFTHLAFSERPSGECQNLEDVGRRIVEKCKGLPLAVKTIGSALRFKKSKDQWESVLDSEMWEIKEVEEGVFLPLLVSYYDLPSILRQCFSFCAIFPEDYVINKDELIKLWMAQGFLHESQHREIEIVGEEYFNELAMRSFFQDFKKNENDDIVSCKLHDLVHNFVRFLTKKECFLVNVDDLKKTRKVSLPFKTIRHSFLLIGESAEFHVPTNNWKKVRTLFIQSNRGNLRGSNLPNSIDKLTSLRILRFGEGLITKKVGKLIHLKYINLSHNGRLETLSKAVCDLYNLQTLDISYCGGLRRLPRGIEKLKNLRYVENECTPSLFMPKGLKRLTGLRILREVNLSTKKSAFNIEDLGNLGNLQGSLTIRGLQRAEASKVRAARLSTMIGVRGLTLDLFSIGEKDGPNEAVVLEALKPPSSLQSLTIWKSEGPTLFPSWMTSLTVLKTLVLFRCDNWESLPPLGKLLSLESLKIEHLLEVRKVGEEFLGIEREEEEEGQTSSSSSPSPSPSSSSIIAFPNLKQLTFEAMYELEDWEYGNLFSSTSSGGITIMPLLRSLHILGCPKLKAVPHHLLHQLQELKIDWCPILSRRFEEQRGEDWPYISHIPTCLIGKARRRRTLKLKKSLRQRENRIVRHHWYKAFFDVEFYILHNIPFGIEKWHDVDQLSLRTLKSSKPIQGFL